MKRVIVALSICLISSSAFAQLKKPQITGDVVKDSQANFGLSGGAQIANTLANSPVVKFFSKWTADDIAAAITLSGSITDLPDDVGKACWTTFGSMGEIIKQHPIPATLNLATDIEAIRLFNMAIKRVCQKPECSQVWNDIQNQVAALAPIPAPISLASICSKIP